MEQTPIPIPDSISLEFVEDLFGQYQADPTSVPEEWRAYFRTFTGDEGRVGPSFSPPNVFSSGSNGADHGNGDSATERHLGNGNGNGNVSSRAPRPTELATDLYLQDRVDQFIRAYRVRGHLIANFNPLGLQRPSHPELKPAYYGFGDEHLDLEFSTFTIFGEERLTLREIIRRLRETYCRSIGVQFMHIDDVQIKNWLQEEMEGTLNHLRLERDEQIRIYRRLSQAVVFEDFIQRKFIGAKSFSLEGSESLIPLLDLTIEHAADQDIGEIVLGMAHRGRLNVLANICGKSPKDIFREFEDSDPEAYRGRGDVKYHLGYTNDLRTAGGKRMHISLQFNPSHLEFVNPVAMGRLRAKQDRDGDLERREKMLVLIHGDAAFAGEGVVQETLNLSELAGYRTGGTMHVIVNNQIGFTTTTEQGCSCTYSTDVAKMLQIPIFHVNGEDPEAVAQVTRLAMRFREKFRRDVVLNLYGYRRRGHNESDEPSFTQPILYQAIAKRKSTREGYLDHLLKLGDITRAEAEAIAVEIKQKLEADLQAARDNLRVARAPVQNRWADYTGGPEDFTDDQETGVAAGRLKDLLLRTATLPENFIPHRKISAFLADRRAMAEGAKPLDWAAGEALAFATLATEGHRVRLTGQDCERGTFSHRHSVLHDVQTGEQVCPLANLSAEQAPVEIINSPLSEVGVLGFEYGYSLSCPTGLTLWEAQFGDFVNAAQVVIDQFIVSGEDKWTLLSGLVMLLPHGFEGQGPEHSSARLERFLMLAAQDNLQVAIPTTPGQYFHLLRRQIHRRWRKPLVVFTPKSLLRHPRASSSLDELAHGRFQRVLADPDVTGPADRIVLCSGKLYFDLVAARQEFGADRVAIVRVEQLYPFPERHLRAVLNRYAAETPVYWVQEEPENMGASRFLRVCCGDRLFDRWPLAHVAREASASPATGSHAAHKREQAEILRTALGVAPVEEGVAD